MEIRYRISALIPVSPSFSISDVFLFLKNFLFKKSGRYCEPQISFNISRIIQKYEGKPKQSHLLLDLLLDNQS